MLVLYVKYNILLKLLNKIFMNEECIIYNKKTKKIREIQFDLRNLQSTDTKMVRNSSSLVFLLIQTNPDHKLPPCCCNYL
jgi:hypothetical protein